jgi:hypothetical protein
MDADLDTLCTVVYCTADDLLPEARPTLAGASATPSWSRSASPRRSWASPPTAGSWRWPASASTTCSRPAQPAGLLEAPPSPGRRDRVAHGRLRPAEPGLWRRPAAHRLDPGGVRRSRETAKRSALGEAAGYGYCAAHSRWFWGFRLHLLAAPDGTPRALQLASRRDEREVGLELLERCQARGGTVLICDKGYAGRDFAASAALLRVPSCGPARRRARSGSPPGADPPAHRVDLLDRQGPAHPGAPRGAHHGRAA